MGLFERFRHIEEDIVVDSSPTNFTMMDTLAKELEEPEIRLQVMGIVTFMIVIGTLRLMNQKRLKALEGEHVLNMSALNDASMYKEVFLAYLNAALLEPVLAIGGMEEVKGQELIINIFTLGSICWWIWMVTDAFDYTDVCQTFKYQAELQPEADADPSQYGWLQLTPKDLDKAAERRTLVGSMQRDVALWFSLGCIGAAWLPGSVTHRDVMHAYAIVFVWVVLHHACRRATTWSAE